ncbi:MAG: hypothetical protein IMW89_19315 [Ktedonobacteraceae bacterium]|nr:hypothetical protein [Ktedonobacteraceae bacterium]
MQQQEAHDLLTLAGDVAMTLLLLHNLANQVVPACISNHQRVQSYHFLDIALKRQVN